LIDEADANRDGVIDFNEFNALMQKNWSNAFDKNNIYSCSQNYQVA
jgi:hypothetical protein